MVDAETRGEMPPWGCALSTAHPTPPLPPCTVGSGSEGEVTPSGHRRVQLAWVAGSRAREAPGQALGEPQGPDRGIRGCGVPHPAQGTPPPPAPRGRARVTRHQQGAPFAKDAGPILQTRGPGWGSVPEGQSPALRARSPPGSLRSLRVAPPPRTPISARGQGPRLPGPSTPTRTPARTVSRPPARGAPRAPSRAPRSLRTHRPIRGAHAPLPPPRQGARAPPARRPRPRPARPAPGPPRAPGGRGTPRPPPLRRLGN